MKVICIFLITCLILIGCSKEEKMEQSGGESMVGYVVKKEENRFLIVSSKANSNGDYTANWVFSTEEVNIGQLVKVFVEGGEIMASDPGKITSNKINILEIHVGEASNQKASKVLENALLQHAELEVPVVKALNYSEISKEWSVILFDSKDVAKKEISVFIKD